MARYYNTEELQPRFGRDFTECEAVSHWCAHGLAQGWNGTDNSNLRAYPFYRLLLNSLSPLLLNSLTPELPYSSTPLLLNSLTPQLPYSSTPLLLNSLIPQLPYSSTPLFLYFSFQLFIFIL
jgi:hypothetical protein